MVESAIDKTYVSERVMRQYAKERQERLDKKQRIQQVPISGKTFAEDGESHP